MPICLTTILKHVVKKCHSNRKGQNLQNGTHILYRGSPHKTVKWETENTVLCEIVLCETILELLPKTVLCETLLCTMRGIEIFQNQSYREISPM